MNDDPTYPDDRGPLALRGGMRGHLCPHGQGPAIRHRRIGPRREPARAAAAPAALTRYTYAMRLPS